MTLRLYGALSYSQNSAHDLRRTLNEQVCRSDGAPMSLDEGAPRHAPAPLRGRRDTNSKQRKHRFHWGTRYVRPPLRTACWSRPKIYVYCGSTTHGVCSKRICSVLRRGTWKRPTQQQSGISSLAVAVLLWKPWSVSGTLAHAIARCLLTEICGLRSLLVQSSERVAQRGQQGLTLLRYFSRKRVDTRTPDQIPAD